MPPAESSTLQPAAPAVFPPAADPLRARLARDHRLPAWLLTGGALLFGWVCLWNKLRIDWTINEQYEYGWFVPPLTAALLALRWKDRPEPGRVARPVGWVLALGAAGVLLLLLPVRLAEGPNPDWRLVYWVHAGALVALSFAAAAASGGRRWVRHFAFPLLFLLVAVPWPSDLEQTVVQSLMRGVAAIAAECMTLLGIPAVAQGNVISVHGQLVGVNEACSGIRSLQTTLMAGLFLGELSRLGGWRRLALLGGGVLMAMAANVFRSSLLVWIAARHGLATLEQYHDATGIAVLFIVFGSLLWLNARLARRPAPRAEEADGGGGTKFPTALPRWAAAAALAWLAAVEIGNVWWYSAPGSGETVMLPRWTVAPPADAPGFQTLPIDERTSRMLRYDHGLSMRWNRPGPALTREDCTLFFFRWDAGHASSLQASMHQPHICLTASGLTMTADRGVRPLALTDGITLPVRRYEFALRGRPLYVFFVVWQDGVSGNDAAGDEPGSRQARLRAVLERRPLVGMQTLEFLVGGPASAEEAEALFAREIATLIHRQS